MACQPIGEALSVLSTFSDMGKGHPQTTSALTTPTARARAIAHLRVAKLVRRSRYQAFACSKGRNIRVLHCGTFIGLHDRLGRHG
jgi:hypothetical protein